MKEILPYLISVIVASISGLWSFISATKKAKTDILSLQESNRLEIEKLMSQHKLDLASLERKHEMEKEKIVMEHNHKMELLQKEAENAMGSNFVNVAVSEMMKMPEIRQQMSSALKTKPKK